MGCQDLFLPIVGSLLGYFQGHCLPSLGHLSFPARCLILCLTIWGSTLPNGSLQDYFEAQVVDAPFLATLSRTASCPCSLLDPHGTT